MVLRFLCAFCVLCGEILSQDLSSLAARAKEALGARRYDEAIRLYTDLTRALPSNGGLRFNLGLALHSSGRYREAIPQFTAALKLDPSLTPARLLLGLAHLKLGQPAEAIAPLTAVVRSEPDNGLARQELADACLQLGRFADAIMHFRRLAELDPRHPKAWQGLGLGHLGVSRRLFEQLEKTPGGEPYAQALLARSQLDQLQYRAAFSLYKRALAALPDLPGLHAGLAEIYRRTGHPDWAATEEERERQVRPPPSPPSGPRALYFQARSHQDAAMDAFARLAALPASAEIYELQAEALRIQGRYQEAAAALREALRLDPGNSRLEAALARNLRLYRDFGAALPIFERLASRDPDNPQLAYELGECLLELQQAERSLPPLEKAVRKRPDFLPARAALGRSYLLLNRPADAIPELQAALPLDEDGTLHFQLLRAAQFASRPDVAASARTGYERLSREARRKQLREAQERITPPDAP